MKALKKISFIILCILLAVVVFYTSCITLNYISLSKKNNFEITERSNNVILLIGDGMGQNHIKTGELIKEMYISTFPEKGLVSTWSHTTITDSAASGTAIASGKKTINGQLGMSFGKKLDTVADFAKSKDKKVGIISTKPVYDATPAAFMVHTRSRRNSEDIVKQIINNDGIDVLFGAGKSLFDGKNVTSDKRAYKNSIEDILADKSEQIFGLFDSVPTDDENSDVKLSALTKIALDKLDNEKGFFLMVEGAKIDSKSHSNDINGMIKELLSFDNAVKVALQYALDNQNTTVIVTADHETGWLKLPKDVTKDTLSDKFFHSPSHTLANVNYYAYGPGSKEIPDKIDNTHWYKIITSLLG